MKNKIDVVLHEGGVPSKDAQPQVTLLLGGKTLSVQWKMSEKLFSKLQATAQGFARDSSRFMGYSDTMQEMKKAGVIATDGNWLLQGTSLDHQTGRGVHGGTQGEVQPGPDKGDRVITYSSTPCMFAR